jgi:hypothetical protein
MKENEHIQLSELEAWILETIDNIGWYAYLWFPVVCHEALNFPDTIPDQEVYGAFSGLIRKGMLQQVQIPRPGYTPEWKPAPAALAAAKDLLRLKFGWPDSYRLPSDNR